mmetsp:Transcript_13289/g.48382  ORF Transcript_13289/g.48382 Transcript_13289/m.48382 type:complete len:326 (-) Transcript_13289:916-1893(-)|eukprot:scaffold1809_cov386-Prasinococcus_capsulatus_cf.AAC.35
MGKRGLDSYSPSSPEAYRGEPVSPIRDVDRRRGGVLPPAPADRRGLVGDKRQRAQDHYSGSSRDPERERERDRYRHGDYERERTREAADRVRDTGGDTDRVRGDPDRESIPFRPSPSSEAQLNRAREANVPSHRIATNSDSHIKVSSTSEHKMVAGRIAHSIRRGNPPEVTGVGAVPVNLAVKAIATARRYLLEDGIDIEVTPSILRSERGGEGIKHGVSLCLAPRACVTKRPRHEVDLSVARSTEARDIAGAIAKRVRTGERCRVSAIGPDCVLLAVQAIAQAREFVAEDCLDLSCLPEFDKVRMEGRDEETSLIRMRVLAHQV